MIQKTLICVLFLLNAFVLHAQKTVQPDKYGQWLMYFGDNKINDHIGIHSELQLRNFFVNKNVHQLLTRIGINYYVDPKIMLTGGYGYIHNQPSAPNIIGASLREHRIWQQMIFRHKTSGLNMEHRYRLEQRFIENKTLETDTLDHRTRYRFQALLSLHTLTPKLNNLFLAGYNELFINLGRKISGEIIDRNRLYFALGYRVNPKLNFQAGYLNEGINTPRSEILNFRHQFQFAVFYNTDFFSGD